jgi:hypothetical protein
MLNHTVFNLYKEEEAFIAQKVTLDLYVASVEGCSACVTHDTSKAVFVHEMTLVGRFWVYFKLI